MAERKPACTVRFYDLGDGWEFEVDAEHDPVKPWAGGTAPDEASCVDSAASYIFYSLGDSRERSWDGPA